MNNKAIRVPSYAVYYAGNGTLDIVVELEVLRNHSDYFIIDFIIRLNSLLAPSASETPICAQNTSRMRFDRCIGSLPMVNHLYLSIFGAFVSEIVK